MFQKVNMGRLCFEKRGVSTTQFFGLMKIAKWETFRPGEVIVPAGNRLDKVKNSVLQMDRQNQI